MVRGRNRIFSDEERQEIVEWYINGAGIVELARTYECWTPKINEILKASGTPFRKSPLTNTPIELLLHRALMEEGVGFATQKCLVGRYIVDISISQALVVIEADGAQFHNRPDAQAKQAIRDAAHEAAGYRMFHFTGKEIKADAARCVRQVMEACGLVRDEEPLYEIRPNRKQARKRKPAALELVCAWCGEKFTAPWRRKFCSPEHVSAHLSEMGKKGKGRPKSAEWRAKIGEANRRRVVTAETRAKMSASAMGKPGTLTGRSPSAETRTKISAALTGRRQDAETRAKKSAAHLGKPMPEGTGAKISAALKGKPKSAEHRANLSRSRSNQIVIEPDPA